MKAAEFNANLLRVRQARLRQTALRQKAASINGPPTYVRQMVGESIRKARFNAMGAIVFNDTANKNAYESAVRAASATDYQSITNPRGMFPALKDDSPYNSDSDMWSRTGTGTATPTDNELFLEVMNELLEKQAKGTLFTDFDAEHVKQYKERFIAKHGPRKPPFQESTMMLSFPSFNEDAQTVAATRQLAEIQTGIDQLERALAAYNQQIKDAEESFKTTTNLEEKKMLDILLNGGGGAQGLRALAADVRKGITSLHAQRRTVAAELNIDVGAATEATSGSFKKGLAYGGGGGAVLGGVVALGIIYAMRKSYKATGRGRGKNPIDIFS